MTEPIWVKSKWKAEELDKQRVEFELLLENGESASGIGQFDVTARPQIDELLWIQIVAGEQLAGASKARQTVFQISQMSADNIELHPNQDIARFRSLLK